MLVKSHFYHIRISYLLLATLSLYILATLTSAAPASESSGKNGSSSRTGLLLSNLFRRQVRQQSEDAQASTENSTEADTEDPQTQTELDAQKFVDSLPGANSNKEGPSTFRERVSDTFGLLREGVSNQFKSLRENFSETVEDLRDTWSNSD